MTESPRILLVRLKSIGDVVLTLPAVNLVRDNFPQARITFLTSAENVSLVRGFAAVDEILVLDRAGLRRLQLRAVWNCTLGLAGRLWQRFDLVVDFQGYGETAWLAWLSRARERWGSVYRPGSRWAYTHGITRIESIHAAEWNRRLLTECGLKPLPARNEFILSEDSLQSARQFLAKHGCDPTKPILYLQPFTSNQQKNWPLDNYLAVARHWGGHGVQVMFGGGPGDVAALELARAAGFLVVAGVPRATDMGLMKLSALIVGGDTGFMHLAVALGCRVLMLMLNSGAGSAVPFGHPDWVVAPPTGAPMAAISVEEVMRASGAAFPEES